MENSDVFIYTMVRRKWNMILYKTKFQKIVCCMTSFGIIKFNKYRENHFIDGVTFVE